MLHLSAIKSVASRLKNDTVTHSQVKGKGMMETYWVCPPDNLADEKVENILADLEPQGRSSPTGKVREDEHSENLAGTAGGRSPRSPSRAGASRANSPENRSQSRDISHRASTLAGGSDRSFTSGPLSSLAALKRQALLLCGAGDARTLPLPDTSPPGQPTSQPAPSPLFSRRSVASPQVPVLSSDDPAGSDAADPPGVDDRSEGTESAALEPRRTSSPVPTTVESVAGQGRPGGYAGEDWC